MQRQFLDPSERCPTFGGAHGVSAAGGKTAYTSRLVGVPALAGADRLSEVEVVALVPE
jgi:hypothetical protein